MRALVLLLALGLSGCSLLPRLLLVPDGYDTASIPRYDGPYVVYTAPPSRVDSTLRRIDVVWGGIDRLSVTRLSGERLDVLPDTAGVWVQNRVLVVRARGRAETLPLAGVSRFVARDRHSFAEALGIAANAAFGGALIGALTATVSEGVGWRQAGRGAAIGAGVGAGIGVIAATGDKNAYDVHVAGFKTP